MTSAVTAETYSVVVIVIIIIMVYLRQKSIEHKKTMNNRRERQTGINAQRQLQKGTCIQ